MFLSTTVYVISPPSRVTQIRNLQMEMLSKCMYWMFYSMFSIDICHTLNALYRMEDGFWQVVNLNKIFPHSPSPNPTPPISLILYFDHSIILIIQLCINLGKIKSILILIDCNIFIFYFYRDLGAQIDGYIAVIAHTLVVGASKVSCIFVHWIIFLFSICIVMKCNWILWHYADGFWAGEFVQ